ncbi:hypothetical protein C8J57DRAFT_1407359, partial [Mycena rebaudengoi]
MAPKPLTMAIFWVLILALNLFAVAVFIWVLSRPNGITRWWNIVLVVVARIWCNQPQGSARGNAGSCIKSKRQPLYPMRSIHGLSVQLG